MSGTRREFLKAGTSLAMATLSGASMSAIAQSSGQKSAAGSISQTVPGAGAEENIQVPKIRFGHVEISRLVLGHNPFYGYGHFNRTLSRMMTDWYTQDRVCEVHHYAASFGINAVNYSNAPRAMDDWFRFRAEGGQMHVIAQVADDGAAMLVEKMKPVALQRQGEVVDAAFREGKMDTVREWCRQARDLGVLVGVGTHKPEVIELVEEQGWDVDFYAGCVYNRSRTPEEFRQMFRGELPEMPREIYLQGDPARMYRVMRQTAKPCFAFKILAAGRIADEDVEQAFRTAFSSIKPIDAVYVGMFPWRKDEVRENATIVHRIFSGSSGGVA